MCAVVCLAVALCCISCGGAGNTDAGAALTPGFSLSSPSIDFPNQGVGTTSTPQSTSLTDVGNANLTLSSIEVTGSNPGDFTLSTNCGSSLAPSGQCTLSVTFKPSSTGTRTASIVFADNAPGSPQAVSLSGTGVASAVSLSTGSLSFGSQAIAITSAARNVTLTNTGSAALSVTNLVIVGANVGDFAEAANTCGGSVAPGSACTIALTFTPSASGERTAILNIKDNAPGSPQAVSLSGTGVAPAVSLSTGSLSFGSQAIAITSATQNVTLANTGSAALSITNLVIVGADAGDFAEAANTCGGSVAPGSACTIALTFTPSASGERTATLNIKDNVPGGTQALSLSGVGSHDVILSWTASGRGGIVAYDVYRGTTSGGESSIPLNPTPINGTLYVDESVVAGATYYYVITAVASNRVQSAASAETEATVPAN